MPRLPQCVAILDNEFPNLGQLSRVESIIQDQLYGIKPELALIVSRLDVNMRRFFALVAEEKGPISSNSQYRRHGGCPKDAIVMTLGAESLERLPKIKITVSLAEGDTVETDEIVASGSSVEVTTTVWRIPLTGG